MVLIKYLDGSKRALSPSSCMIQSLIMVVEFDNGKMHMVKLEDVNKVYVDGIIVYEKEIANE